MTLYITPFGRIARRKFWSEPVRREDWPAVESDLIIPINVKAGADDFTLTALLPGVKAEDLSIQVVNETVTLQGELKEDVDEKENYLVHERPAGRFVRVIRLPEPLNPNQAEADLTDGVLTLRVPKAEEARPRTIKISAK